MKGLKLLFVLVAMSGVAGMGMASITDVEILPETLTIYDSLNILVSGVENFSINISDSLLTVDNTSIELDIYLQEGMLPVVTQWSHSEELGLLSIGIYDLTVNTINEMEPDFDDTYYTSFEVIPEPTTALLLGSAFIILRKVNSFGRKGF